MFLETKLKYLISNFLWELQSFCAEKRDKIGSYKVIKDLTIQTSWEKNEVYDIGGV